MRLPTLRLLLFSATLLLALSAAAQGGIRLIIWNYDNVIEEYPWGASYGVGYDHDLEQRLSMGLDLRLGTTPRSYSLTYRSAYHFSDARSTSFYIGPNVGFKSYSSRTMVPLGFRMGLRGGLERFYADLHIGMVYTMGNMDPLPYIDAGSMVQPQRLGYMVGVDIGFGWEKASR